MDGRKYGIATTNAISTDHTHNITNLHQVCYLLAAEPRLYHKLGTMHLGLYIYIYIYTCILYIYRNIAVQILYLNKLMFEGTFSSQEIVGVFELR